MPKLEDGSSPTTPPDDTLQRQLVLAWAARIEAEAKAMGDEVVRTDGEPVATAAGFWGAGVNLVEIISTVAAARGRGVGAAITWPATLADPVLPAVLVASDLGRPVYERMGYLAISRHTLWLGGLG